jgi:hypothetical protein
MILHFFPETTNFGPVVEMSSLKFFSLQMTEEGESVSETSWFEEKNHKMIVQTELAWDVQTYMVLSYILMYSCNYMHLSVYREADGLSARKEVSLSS